MRLVKKSEDQERVRPLSQQCTGSVFCQPVCSKSIRCEPMPFISRRDVFFFVVIQTTSKHWAQWSLHLPCSLSRDEVGVRLLWVCPLWGTWPVYFFLYRGWCGEWAQSKTWKQKGRTCGLMLWSERPFFACEFVQFVFSCTFEWELLYILMFMFVCAFDCFFCIDLCFHLYCCRFFFFCLFVYLFLFPKELLYEKNHVKVVNIWTTTAHPSWNHCLPFSRWVTCCAPPIHFSLSLYLQRSDFPAEGSLIPD